MATAAVVSGNDTVVAEIFIAAPPERVFQAITDPAQSSQWWGQKGMYRVAEKSSDLRPGGKWSTSGVGADGTKFTVDGEYLEVDPPKLLVHTWNPSYKEHPKATVVRWELKSHSVHGLRQSGPQKMGTGTLVKLTHSGFAGDEKDAADHGNGWKRVFGWLQLYVEKGQTVDTRD